jgi:phosphohistidine phosphatase
MVRRTRTLYVLRHAKSSWDEPVADFDRPLSLRGQRAAKQIAAHLGRERIHPGLILCSASWRTRETLRILAPVLGTATVSVEGNLYGASATEVLDRLRQVNKRTPSVMVIAHNPGLQDLVLSLASTGSEVDSVREKFPTAALATLEFDRPWGELEPDCARLAGYVRPRDLPRA